MAKRQSAALQRIYDAKGAQNVLLLVRSSTVHIACMKSGNATTYAFPLYTNNEKANTQPSLHEMTNCKASTDIDDPDIIHLLVHIQERFLYHYILTMRPILTLKLHSYRTLPRNALAICMALTESPVDRKKICQVILIGEKTGKVMAIPLEHAEGSKMEINHLFGHTTSMITDICMDPSKSRYVLSADRDEKIRVSHFPQTALIQSYCLGHSSAVVQLACCQRSQAQNWMISLSKDGTIKLWDYMNSTLLDSKTLYDSENTQIDACKLAICPFTDCIAVIMGVHFALLRSIRSEDKSPKLEIIADSTSTSMYGTLTLESEPLDATFSPECSQSEHTQVVISYRHSPYLRCFQVNNLSTIPTITSSEHFHAENWFSFGTYRSDLQISP